MSAIPEVRQCQDPNNIRGLFGTVAVWSEASNNWGIMTPQDGTGRGGGGWLPADFEEVLSWPVIQERTEITDEA